jgi:hypothetical protein
MSRLAIYIFRHFPKLQSQAPLWPLEQRRRPRMMLRVTGKSRSCGNRSSRKSARHVQLMDQRLKRYSRRVAAWM